jgi:hypothetical protein
MRLDVMKLKPLVSQISIGTASALTLKTTRFKQFRFLSIGKQSLWVFLNSVHNQSSPKKYPNALSWQSTVQERTKRHNTLGLGLFVDCHQLPKS